MIPASLIIAEAEKWHQLKCVETSQNRGPCVDEIKKAYWNTEEVGSEAWCAEFAWVVASEAARRAGVANPLPKTASAVGMRDQSRAKGLRVDKNPVPGSVFYRKPSNRATSSGHVGIVHTVESNRILTIEGNAGENSDRVAFLEHSKADIESARWGYVFIHIESGSPVLAGIPLLPSLIILGVGGYFAWEYFSS